MYHAVLSYRRIEPFVDRSYEAIRQWFYRLKDLFEPGCRDRREVAVDETKIEIDGDEHYVWPAVDCETLKELAVEVSPGRSSLDALLFLKDVLERCRGRPLVRTDRGPWYDWPLELLDCEYERETWGNRSLIEAWFGIFTYRTRRFYHRFPYQSTASSARSWLTAFAALHNATL
ncbi:transposase, IS240 [Natrinema pellirubrum DSM 15624]|uniref:Transposase, IS240 n=1 Tax=Natrinema pellirubrum (strain DSM 15624 / CIP 106293 / JCM 10476 / NCIMB 786 / 157) TaxID=797303 RepID=L9Y9L8_NATP1|nr:transposase, IS240 [Natrinema pellirubrum DSM 15624]